MNPLAKHASLTIAAFLIGLLGYLTLVNHYAYLSALNELRGISKVLATRITLTGTVEHIDPTGHSITIRVPHYAGTAQASVQIVFDNETRIVRQRFIREGDLYVGIESLTPATLESLTPGEAVSVDVLINVPTQTYQALVILVEEHL